MRISVALLLLIVGCLGAPGKPSMEALLEEAATAATRAPDLETRALCLAQVAAAWAPLKPDRAAELAQQAIEAACAHPDLMTRALSLRTVALRLDKVNHARAVVVLEQSVEAARGIKFAVQRAVALREAALAALKITPEQAAALAQEALAAAKAVPEAIPRAACLRDLGAGLYATDATLSKTILTEARAALASCAANDAELPLALAELAGAWARSDVATARAVAAQIPAGPVRADALTMAARSVASANHETALLLAYDILDEPLRARAVAAAAAAVPPSLAPAAESLARLALGMMGSAKGEVADETQADAAVALARPCPEEALRIARAIAGDDGRHAGIAGVAERIAERDPAAAVGLLAEVKDPLAAEPVLARVVVRLAGTDPDRAVTLARGILGRRLRVEALLGIAAAIGPAPAL